MACKKFADAKFIIIAAALPKDVEKMKLWKETKKKQVFVIGVGSNFEKRAAQLAVAGYTKLDEKADFSKLETPADYSKAFAMRYKLIVPTGKI